MGDESQPTRSVAFALTLPRLLSAEAHTTAWLSATDLVGTGGDVWNDHMARDHPVARWFLLGMAAGAAGALSWGSQQTSRWHVRRFAEVPRQESESPAFSRAPAVHPLGLGVANWPVPTPAVPHKGVCVRQVHDSQTDETTCTEWSPETPYWYDENPVIRDTVARNQIAHNLRALHARWLRRGAIPPDYAMSHLVNQAWRVQGEGAEIWMALGALILNGRSVESVAALVHYLDTGDPMAHPTEWADGAAAAPRVHLPSVYLYRHPTGMVADLEQPMTSVFHAGDLLQVSMGHSLAADTPMTRLGVSYASIVLREHWAVPTIDLAGALNFWGHRDQTVGFRAEAGLGWHLPAGIELMFTTRVSFLDLLADLTDERNVWASLQRDEQQTMCDISKYSSVPQFGNSEVPCHPEKPTVNINGSQYIVGHRRTYTPIHYGETPAVWFVTSLGKTF